MNNKFISGNLEDKYHAKNPISKILVNGFLKAFKYNLITLKNKHNIDSICEIGVGDGTLLKVAAKVFPKAKLYGCDLSKNEIKKSYQKSERV